MTIRLRRRRRRRGGKRRRVPNAIASCGESSATARARGSPACARMRAMNNALERLAGRLESWVDGFARTAAWLVLAVVFLLFVQNPLREYVGRGQFVANDMGQLTHATVFMIGIAYAWRWDRQVRVDLFYRSMSARGRALV